MVMLSGASTGTTALPLSSVVMSRQIQVSGKNWRTRFTSARPSGGASPGMAMAAAVLNSTTLGSTKDSSVGVGGVCADPLQCPSTRIHNPRALVTRSVLALPPRSRVLIGLI